jgi:hypothetical protein
MNGAYPPMNGGIIASCAPVRMSWANDRADAAG